MTLSRLSVSHLRNIVEIDVEFAPGVNLVNGDNGSGKTSLLEAVYFLGSGRSFRSYRLDPVINRDAQGCTVFGVLGRGDRVHRVGVYRGRDGSRDIKVNGEVVSRASELARVLPVLMLGPDTVDVLLGPPALRRRFLNWGLFHVEPRFLSDWEMATRCLKQRNALLREYLASDSEIAVWTDQLCEVSLRLHGYRVEYFKAFGKRFAAICERLSGLANVTCHYRRGWNSERELAEVYEDQLGADKKRGFTGSGIHKAEMELLINGVPAVSVCSRGELKVLAWALYLSQGRVSSELGGVTGLVYLVDDIAAELDATHREKVCSALLESECQVIATGIELDQLLNCWGGATTKLFHVEHGDIRVMENQV
jgi:DNA replication and repair protein RecF